MIKIGNLQINKLYLGSYEIVAAYLGNTQVYGGTGPGPEPGEWILDENSYIVGADGQYYERWVQYTFTVPTTDLNDDDWKVDTVGTEYDTDPDFNYFMSDKNWHVSNSFAQCKVSWIGPTNFNLKYRSNAESIYDYIVIGGLDGDKFETQPNWNTEGILAHTKGQQGGDYKDLYIDCDEGEHHVWCAYIKDSSADSGDDRAYIGVPKYISTITAERAGDLLPYVWVRVQDWVKVDDEHVAFKEYKRYTLPSGATVDNPDDYRYVEQVLCDYLTYTLCDGVDNTTIELRGYDIFVEQTGQSLNLEYQINDGDWNTWDMQQLTLTRDAASGKGYIKFRGVNPNWSYYNYSTYSLTLYSNNQVNVSGNVISIIDGQKNSTELNVSLYSLFSGSNIVDASLLQLLPLTLTHGNEYACMFEGSTVSVPPVLPATTLSQECYRYMFNGCSSLVNAPALPATTIPNFSYQGMFSGCTSLVNAPALPATTIGYLGYGSMFEDCTSLVNAPALPATEFISSWGGEAQECYINMFKNCTSLVNAPALPATNLCKGIYYAMFSGCTALTSAPALPAETLTQDCYTQMFYDCQSLQTAPVLPAATLTGSCYSYMFANCFNLNNVTCLATDMSAYGCTEYWLISCASEGTFTKAVGADWSSLEEPSGIPQGWTVIEQ